MTTPCPVVHFEMPYADRERMAKFYASAFGWQTTMLGEDMGNYVLAETTTSECGRATGRGEINGGFYPQRPGLPRPCVVIAVADIDAAMQSVREAGGKVHGAPMDIPGIGRYIAFSDTEGNCSSMLQPIGGNCPEA